MEFVQESILMKREFKMGIRLLEVDNGYERTIYESNTRDIFKTLQDVNRVMEEKFGSNERLELVRNHKRRREP